MHSGFSQELEIGFSSLMISISFRVKNEVQHVIGRNGFLEVVTTIGHLFDFRAQNTMDCEHCRVSKRALCGRIVAESSFVHQAKFIQFQHMLSTHFWSYTVSIENFHQWLGTMVPVKTKLLFRTFFEEWIPRKTNCCSYVILTDSNGLLWRSFPFMFPDTRSSVFCVCLLFSGFVARYNNWSVFEYRLFKKLLQQSDGCCFVANESQPIREIPEASLFTSFLCCQTFSIFGKTNNIQWELIQRFNSQMLNQNFQKSQILYKNLLSKNTFRVILVRESDKIRSFCAFQKTRFWKNNLRRIGFWNNFSSTSQILIWKLTTCRDFKKHNSWWQFLI